MSDVGFHCKNQFDGVFMFIGMKAARCHLHTATAISIIDMAVAGVEMPLPPFGSSDSFDRVPFFRPVKA
jgi:hypothetical protein